MGRQTVHIRSDPSIEIVDCASSHSGIVRRVMDVEGLVVRPLMPDVQWQIGLS
jgi:hypothetical protein